MTDCHTCRQMTVTITRARADVLGIAKAMNRAEANGRPLADLAEKLATAKAILAGDREVLDQHATSCEVAS